MLVLREKLDSRILQNTLTLNHASYSLHYSGNKNAQVKTILIFRLFFPVLGVGPTLLRPSPPFLKHLDPPLTTTSNI